jgi:biopolymer transport protein ExbD
MLTDPNFGRTYMKLLNLILLIACLTSCNAQHQNNQANDTAKLFDPSNENDGIAKIIEAKNAIILQKDFYEIILGDKEYSIIGIAKVAKFINDSSTTINKKKFYIIIDSSKSFKDIVEIIDIIKHAKIANYQVCNLQTKNKIPESIQVQAPKSVDIKIDPKDSSYLKITVAKNGYKISLPEDSLTTTEINNIDTFLLENIIKVNKNKVFVMGNSKEKYDRFKVLMTVLKKYEIFRFSIVTEPNY